MNSILLDPISISRYQDGNDFPIGDLDLKIEGLPKHNGEFRFVCALNGNTILTQKVSAESNYIHIPQSQLHGGCFSCEVMHFIKGKEVKRYKVEDLRIIEIENCLTASPVIMAIQNEIKSQQNAYKNQINKIILAIYEMQDAIDGLLCYAKSSYYANPYVGENKSDEEFEQLVKNATNCKNKLEEIFNEGN